MTSGKAEQSRNASMQKESADAPPAERTFLREQLRRALLSIATDPNSAAILIEEVNRVDRDFLRVAALTVQRVRNEITAKLLAEIGTESVEERWAREREEILSEFDAMVGVQAEARPMIIARRRCRLDPRAQQSMARRIRRYVKDREKNGQLSV